VNAAEAEVRQRHGAWRHSGGVAPGWAAVVPWRRLLLGGVVFGDPSRLEAFLVHWSWAVAEGVGNSASWQTGQVLQSSRGGVRRYGGGRRLSHVWRLWLLVADRGG
jgi:hypothetical protein